MLEPMRIAAPVTSPAEAEQVLDAGADELYFGLLLPEWTAVLEDADLWSRRQGQAAHAASLDDALAIAAAAAARGRTAALALNARYTRRQAGLVQDAAAAWEAGGGQAVIVSDLGLLAGLQRRDSRLRRHLSLLAGVYNARSVALFVSLGVCRVILPRDLTVAEIRNLTRAAPPVEYEALAIYQRCPFQDELCGFHHRPRLPPDEPAEFAYSVLPGRPLPVTLSGDPEYEGHGCQLPWRTPAGLV